MTINPLLIGEGLLECRELLLEQWKLYSWSLDNDTATGESNV